MLSACGGALTEETIEAWLTGFQRALPLTHAEHALLLPAMKAAVVCSLASLFAADDPADEAVGAHFTSLRTLSALDLGELLERTDALDRLLRRDPAGVYPKMDRATRAQYREMLSRQARRRGVSERDHAEALLRRRTAPPGMRATSASRSGGGAGAAVRAGLYRLLSVPDGGVLRPARSARAQRTLRRFAAAPGLGTGQAAAGRGSPAFYQAAPHPAHGAGARRAEGGAHALRHLGAPLLAGGGGALCRAAGGISPLQPRRGRAPLLRPARRSAGEPHRGGRLGRGDPPRGGVRRRPAQRTIRRRLFPLHAPARLFRGGRRLARMGAQARRDPQPSLRCCAGEKPTCVTSGTRRRSRTCSFSSRSTRTPCSRRARRGS